MRILYLEYIQQIGALPANAILASRVTTCTNRSYVRLQILSTLHTAESCFPWGDHVSILRLFHKIFVANVENLFTLRTGRRCLSGCCLLL